ncbi:MAG: tetratricopeptide repeat protein [Phycisphaerae bacterium]|nr:tetratricopeptide repeat protein [Phycisphaerae bacterium]
METTRNSFVAMVIVLVMSTMTGGEETTSPRRIPEGALAPEFSAVDVTGQPYAYTRSSGKVLILAFLSSQQRHSQEAVESVYRALSSVPADRLTSCEVAFVLQDMDNTLMTSIQKEAPCAIHILGNDQYHIWGQFGIIATPTVLISDRQGKVLCVKPGLAYDEAPVIKSRLFQALELPYDISPDKASVVRTVTNSTISAKANRHLKMARLLMGKNRVGPAIEQAQMAYQLDPGSPEVAVALGDLLCLANRVDQAPVVIRLLSEVSVQTNRDKARINLALGWANREVGKLEEAEQCLQAGIQQDPTSPRLFFELGRVYQACNDSERAMKAYFRALQLVYPEG